MYIQSYITHFHINLATCLYANITYLFTSSVSFDIATFGHSGDVGSGVSGGGGILIFLIFPFTLSFLGGLPLALATIKYIQDHMFNG